MSEITTLLSSDDITVLGPPSIVNVQTDIGPSGDRGSKIFVGIGHPNSNGINEQQDIKLNDIFINNLISANYSYMYQYVSQPGGNTWTPVLRVNPTIYSTIDAVSFTDGEASLHIKISDITDASLSSLLAENFSVQLTPIYQNPVAISISSIALGGLNDDELVVSLTGVESSSGSWQALNDHDPMTVNVFITLVLS
jgi:hypothetical protein